MAKIRSDRGYAHTKATVESMEYALQDYRERGGSSKLSPKMRQATMDGMQSLIDEWREEMQAYEALKSGQRKVEVRSVEDVPDALILGRIAAGLTQKQLAQRLGLKAQQIQRYEATGYRTITLERAREIARALGLTPAELAR